jgi:heat-inducible transcriptional repressor
MQRGRLLHEEEERINSLRDADAVGPEEVLAEASRILSALTQEAGVALVPQLGHGSFRHLELIPVGQGQIVGVLISSEGMVRHAPVELAGEIPAEDLEELESALNRELEGMPLSQACAYLEKCFSEMEGRGLERWRGLLDVARLGALFEEEADVILEGTSWILEAPEFQDMDRTRRLMRALDNRREIVQILQKDLLADEVKLHIGAENRGTSLTDCTIAAAPYRLRGGVMGVIGVMGPTRMNYPRVTAMVGRMGQTISRIFQESGAW